MNETIVVENGQAAVATTSVSGTLSPASSATDTIAIVDTPAGKQAALKVYNLNSGGGGGASGDYLPLSGGTMTGALAIHSTETKMSVDPNSPYQLCFGSEAFPKKIIFGLGGCSILPFTNNYGEIGDEYKRWKVVYTNSINNGADIAVPTTGGTLARIEDIDAAVGDISTALTAILGE